MREVAVLVLLTITSVSSAKAGMIVTIGDVTGTNTTLSVAIQGSGVITSELLGVAPPGSWTYYDDFSGTTSTNERRVVSATSVAPNSNIGNYINSTYTSPIGERLVTALVVSNLTTGTSANAQWLFLDNDASSADDFFVALDTQNASLFNIGHSYFVEGVTTVALQSGDASDFNLGTFSYSDPSIGVIELRIQEDAASLSTVPEPSANSLLIGCLAMACNRRSRRRESVCY